MLLTPLLILSVMAKLLLALVMGIMSVVLVVVAAMFLGFLAYWIIKIIGFVFNLPAKYIIPGTWDRIKWKVTDILFGSFAILVLVICAACFLILGCHILKAVFRWNIFPGWFGL